MSREKLMALAEKWRKRRREMTIVGAAKKAVFNQCADELENALAASAESSEVVAYVNLEMWKSNKYWPDDCFRENPFDGCVRLIVHHDDRAATQEGL